MPVLDLTDLTRALPRRTPLVGLDLGTRTIGVSVSDTSLTIASPLGLIRRSKFTHDVEALFGLMGERGAGALVIGLPVNMDGTEGPRCQSARAFGRHLLRIRDLPIAYWDERLSTAAVNRVLIDEADRSRRRRSELVDALAATWILQGALDRMAAPQAGGATGADGGDGGFDGNRPRA
jgi:putative Holliday junction resolvase